MSIRGAIAWAIYSAGRVWWRATDWIGERYEWPYLVYHRLMCWSDDLQGSGTRWPWGPVTQEEIDRIAAMVAPEFAKGDWQTVESETVSNNAP